MPVFNFAIKIIRIVFLLCIKLKRRRFFYVLSSVKTLTVKKNLWKVLCIRNSCAIWCYFVRFVSKKNQLTIWNVTAYALKYADFLAIIGSLKKCIAFNTKMGCFFYWILTILKPNPK